MLATVDEISSVADMLRDWRENCDITFRGVYQNAADMFGGPLPMPRIAKRQQHRQNVPADSSEEYFRRVIWIPFLDDILSQLDQRFLQHRDTAFRLSLLLPRSLENVHDAIRPLTDIYAEYLPETASAVEAEFERWKAKWTMRSVEDRPQTALDALRECDSVFFPCISILLRIFVTLPVTTMTAERSFSALKLLKTYLRSTMSSDRLNGLALMFIHPEISIDIDAVVDGFSLLKRRHVCFA